MNRIFVDTSGWGDLVDVRQHFHRETRAIYETAKKHGTRLVTTNYVLAELVSLLSSPLRIPRDQAIAFVDGIRNSSLVDIIHIDEDLDLKSWNLLSDRADKNWSLVDCSSFVIMREQKIVEAITADHHFEQAGFVRLLK